jgi:hypothetical protein
MEFHDAATTVTYLIRERDSGYTACRCPIVDRMC